jgi:hypothetical protein
MCTSPFQKELSSASPTEPPPAVWLLASPTSTVTPRIYRSSFPTSGPPTKWGRPACEPSSTHLDKESSAMGLKPKTTILLFPHSVEAMTLLSDATQNPAWFICYDIFYVHSRLTSRQAREASLFCSFSLPLGPNSQSQ